MDPRPEGVYCEWVTEPPQGGPYAVKLLHIERVGGDGKVKELYCTRDEAKEIIRAWEARYGVSR